MSRAALYRVVQRSRDFGFHRLTSPHFALRRRDAICFDAPASTAQYTLIHDDCAIPAAMARLSGMGAPVTPERTPEGAESEAVTNEEGSFIDSGRKSTDKHRQTTQHSNDATGDNPNNAMGQGESIESRQERSATIRAASQMATQSNSKKRGTLPSYSARKPQTSSGQRRLAPNPLSRPNVYDVPSDDELPRRRRHTSSARPFSPLKRHARQTSRTLEEAAREDQRLADAQLGQYQQFMQQVEDIAEDNCSAGAKIRARKESRRMRMSAERIETAQDDQAEADQDDTIEVRGSSAQPQDQITDNDVTLDHSANAEGQDANVHQDRSKDEPQLVVKRKRGRPSKAATGDEKRPPTGEKRKRGRPSKNAVKQAENARATESGSTALNANEEGELRRRSTRHAPKSSAESKGGNGDREEAPPPSKRQKQSSVRSQAALKSPDRTAEGQAVAGSQQEIHATELMDDDPQPANISSQHNEDEENVEEEEADEDGDDGEEEIDTVHGELPESDEDDAEAPSDETDQHRLYGHWARFRKIFTVAKKYNGAKVRTKNPGFKKLLEDCEMLTSSIRATASVVGAEELNQFVSRCTSILKRSRKICGHGDSQVDFSDKKLGFHIFKHLIPALALLLYAIVRGFEVLDVETTDNQQISPEHLRTVLDIMVAIGDSEKSAHDGFLKLSERANKRKIHEGIAIPLRAILDSLRRVHRTEIAERQARAAREEAVRDMDAQTREMERRARHRKLSDANHSHWNHLNLMRVRVANTFNRQKLLHLRSCPASLVETMEDGMPYLRDEAHVQQAQWTMPELAALQNCLKNFPDSDSVPPCQSKVFETIIDKACRPGGALADRNVLEIVITANEMKDNFISMRLERDEDIELWLERIPRWVGPRRVNSAEDAIEV